MTTGSNIPPAMPSPIDVPWPGDFEKVEIAPAEQNQTGALQTDTLETAACLWEAVLTLRDHPAPPIRTPSLWHLLSARPAMPSAQLACD